MDGFSYNGIHCSTYNVGYIPDASDRWWNDPDFELYQKDVSWKNGGYYYGSSVKIRTIELKCYFEEISIATREKIRKWFHRDTNGKLVFDSKPFMYYNVRPQSIVMGTLYNDNNGTYSGTFTVKFTLEAPFGYLTRKSNTGEENDNANDYCGLIYYEDMPDPPTTSSTSFDVYNPGTEKCGLSIKISGTNERKFRFFNTLNNTVCVIDSLPSNLVLSIDGDTGNVITYADSAPTMTEYGFAYHDYGIVVLNPNESYVGITYTAEQNGTMYDVVPLGGNVIVTNDMIGGTVYFLGGGNVTVIDTPDSGGGTVRELITSGNVSITDTPSLTGGTIRIIQTGNDAIGRIESVDTVNNSFTCSLISGESVPAYGNMNIITMNHIVIEEQNSEGNWVTPTGLSLTSIEIDYTPRVL